jgi:signal transduction histidine kinase
MLQALFLRHPDTHMWALFGQRHLFTPKKPHWWTGVLLSLAIGLLFYLATASWIESDSQERFRNLAQNAQHSIAARVKSYTDLLRGTASLFHTSDTIEREQFHRFVEGMALEQGFPAIESVSFARCLNEAERPAYEQKMRAHKPDFAIEPPGRRGQYAVVTFVEPMANWSHTIGTDIAARAHVAAALDEARDTGRIITSGRPIPAMSRQHHVGLGLRQAVYRYNMPINTVTERRAAYLGSVGIAFSVATLMHGVLDEMPTRNVRLTLSDAGESGNGVHPAMPMEEQILFDSSNVDFEPAAAAASNGDTFNTTLLLEFHGRQWKAHFSTHKNNLYTGFDAYFPWLAMVAGFTSSLLIYALFHTLSSSRQRAIKMAKAMTKELRDSQAKLQLSHQKLRRLAAHADQIKEGERKRIAREIHDDLGQNLLALRIEADMLASRTRLSHSRLNARALSTLSHIDATIKSVRQIINDLRPNVLDLGLNAAVDWQVAEFQRRTGIVCELVENQHEISLNDNCATAFFRILQESLSNISRHASASRVRVELKLENNHLSMTVSDNGVGVLASGRNKVGSFGLVGIEERMSILGGKFSLISSPGAGTTVLVSVAVHDETGDDAQATAPAYVLS